MSASKIVMRILSISFTVLVFILIVYGLYQAGLYSYDYGYRIFAEPAVTQEGKGSDKLVQIDNSMNDLDIAKLLEEKGLIRDHRLFVLQLKLSAYNHQLKPGCYTLNTSMTALEMMQVISGEEDTEDAAEE